jgi:hypothetical protein
LRINSIFAQRWFRIILSFLFHLLSHCNFYHLTNIDDKFTVIKYHDKISWTMLKFWFYFIQRWCGVKKFPMILDIIILSSNQCWWWDYCGRAPHIISCWWWFQCQNICMINFDQHWNYSCIFYLSWFKNFEIWFIKYSF